MRIATTFSVQTAARSDACGREIEFSGVSPNWRREISGDLPNPSGATGADNRLLGEQAYVIDFWIS
jgi:hypothetical protein